MGGYQIYLRNKLDVLLHRIYIEKGKGRGITAFIVDLITDGLNSQADAEAISELKISSQKLNFEELGGPQSFKQAADFFGAFVNYLHTLPYEQRSSLIEDIVIIKEQSQKEIARKGSD